MVEMLALRDFPLRNASYKRGQLFWISKDFAKMLERSGDAKPHQITNKDNQKNR